MGRPQTRHKTRPTLPHLPPSGQRTHPNHDRHGTERSPQATPSKLVDEKTTHTSPAPADSTHPGAAPRTSTLSEENPGATVAGSSATTTERPETPPHAEAPA